MRLSWVWLRISGLDGTEVGSHGYVEWDMDARRRIRWRSLDLARITMLHEQVAREIQLGIEYDPAPPFNSGSPKTAGSSTGAAAK